MIARLAPWLLLLTGPMAASAQTALGKAESESLLRRVDAHYNHLRSLHARYHETYSGMGLTRDESGTLTLARPSRMLWQYDRPAGKVFVLDGKFATFYTPGDAQAQRLPATKLDDLRSPLRFLLGHTELRRELSEIAVAPEPGGFSVGGVPRPALGHVARLTLHVTEGGVIRGMRLEELDGAVTEFTFSDLAENLPVDASVFRFVLPPGVQLADGVAPI